MHMLTPTRLSARTTLAAVALLLALAVGCHDSSDSSPTGGDDQDTSSSVDIEPSVDGDSSGPDVADSTGPDSGTPDSSTPDSGTPDSGTPETTGQNPCDTDNGGCDPLVTCTATDGEATCGDCPSGYAGDGTTGCTDIDECATDNGGCDPLTTCTNTDGGRSCSECPDGYSGDGEAGCTDIDECATDNGGCDPLTTCTNTDGGRTCGECPDGYTGDGSAGCTDVDECETDNGGCDALVGCTNTPGSWTCGPCPSGYAGDGAVACVDIDECLEGTSGCDPLVDCTNQPGGFLCGDCPSGYTGGRTTGCVDIDECAANNGGCDPLAACINAPGSHSCGACPAGYSGGGDLGCSDIDECTVETDTCDPLVTCTNTVGSYTCGDCPAGYDGEGSTGCTDVNECATDNGSCDPVVECTNTPGGRTCGVCPDGYTGDGEAGCVDVNECATANGGCAQTCTNVAGSFECGCEAGFELLDDGIGCADINECADANGGCAVHCHNTVGGHTCFCRDGFALAADGISCTDIDECETENGGCAGECQNTAGSFHCGCANGFQVAADGTSCVDIDECADDNGGCDPMSPCLNVVGGPPECGPCAPGFTGTGDAGCVENAPVLSGTVVEHGASDEEFEAFRDAWQPTLPPNRNELIPVPGVLVTTDAQRNAVEVTPEQLRFPASQTEVLDWEKGRVLVSAPGDAGAPGRNPFGFLRKVDSVEQTADGIIVHTVTAALEEAVHGELQVAFDADTARVVEWDEFDHEWAADNLYVDVGLIGDALPIGLRDNTNLEGVDEWGAPELPGAQWGFLKRVFRAIKKVIKSVVKAVKKVYARIVPSSFKGSVRINKELKLSGGSDILGYEFAKSFGDVEFKLTGTGFFYGSVEFNPRTSIGMRIPNPIGVNKPSLKFWLDIDAYLNTEYQLGLTIDAAVVAAGGETDPELSNLLGEATPFAQGALARIEQLTMGDPSLKPVGGVKRTLYISKPATKTILAGPLPVILTQTFQLDLECGAELKASLTADVANRTSRTFKFRAVYEKGGESTVEPPAFGRKSNTTVYVTGSGEASVACGLIPRLNVYAYDAVGINLGIRGSVQAKASYSSSCDNAATTHRPDGEVALDLGASLGIQFGGRVQVPGSSYAGKAGQKLGFDVGPAELWTTGFSFFNRTWFYPEGGLGYCAPFCTNGVLDDSEMGVDCGGACPVGCPAGTMCEVNRDCADGLYCTGGFCSDDHCGDGVLSGTETATDCGGPSCEPCTVGKVCILPSDCTTNACYIDTAGTPTDLGVCVDEPCIDNQRGGDECGIDCGDACDNLCPLGASCTDASQCESGLASDYGCVPESCLNLTVDAGETDLDCGGDTVCPRCAPGKTCNVDSDCSAAAPRCDPVARICFQLACLNGVLDGQESDVDCGGTCELRCTVGRTCNATVDCAAGLDCHPTDGICVAATCSDGWKGALEGDVDCGTPCETLCELGQTCALSTDCASGICAAGICAATDCSDRLTNGDETDVDCGGSCKPCLEGRACSVAADCLSGVCLPSGLCAAPACDDGVRNGVESALDCGGGCPGCPVGAECNSDLDCASNSCDLVTRTCLAPSCSDDSRNGDEGDVDCGGTCGVLCDAGDLCNADTDCVTNACIGGLCSEAYCGDEVLSGTETDVDCGGGCVMGCDDGQGCQTGADCQSLSCSGTICLPATCTDGIQNGGETGLDCGGPCVEADKTCPAGQGCGAAGDCASGVCTEQICAAPTCDDQVMNGDEAGIDCGGGTCGACPFASLGTLVPSAGAAPYGFTAVSDRSVFVATDSRGRELWVTDGTAAGTSPLPEIHPSGDAFEPRTFERVVLGDLVLFFATEPAGDGIWRTDGTENGTFRLALVDSPQGLVASGGRAYFSANGGDLWETDGTGPGTGSVDDGVDTGYAGIEGISAARVDSTVVYARDDQLLYTPSGDGTSVPVAFPYPNTSVIVGPITVNGVAVWGYHYALANNSGIMKTANATDVELVFGTQGKMTTGTDAFDRTRPMLVPTPDGRVLFEVAGKLYCSDPVTPGSNVELGAVKYQRHLGYTHAGGKTFFATDSSGWLVSTDCTVAGTTYFKGGGTNAQSLTVRTPIWSVDGYVYTSTQGNVNGPSNLVRVNAQTLAVEDLGQVFAVPYSPLAVPELGPAYVGGVGTTPIFAGAANNTEVGYLAGFGEPFALDPTGAAAMVADINEMPPENHFEAVYQNSTAYFVAGSTTAGFEFWSSDGTPGGTSMSLDWYTGTGGVAVSQMVPLDNGLIVFGNAGALWAWNGTAATPWSLGLSQLSTDTSVEISPTRGDVVLCAAKHFSTGAGIYKTHGAKNAHTLVQSIGALSQSADHRMDFTFLNDTQTLYAASDATDFVGVELWVTDGTTATQVKDINPGAASSSPRLGALLNSGFMAFSAITESEGRELWVTDGTAANTVLLADIAQGKTSSAPRDFVSLGSMVLFRATTASSGLELYRTDGTYAGTQPVLDLNPGAGDGAMSHIVVAGTHAFFIGDGGSGPQLYKTDGTAEGTVALTTLPGGKRQLTAAGDRLFFVADTADFGEELWVTDGTPAGTSMAGDLAPGMPSSSPANLSWDTDGGTLYFTAKVSGIRSHWTHVPIP